MSATAQIEAAAPVIEEIEIASITRDVVVRAKGTNRVTVSEYAAAMLANGIDSFPPIICYRDSRNVTRLSEGAHRLEAALATGATTIRAEVRSGGRKECLAHAVSTGRDFGLRFSTRDKRHQCELMLGNFPKWSDRKIAEALGIDHKTVAATKRRLAEPAPEPGEIPQGDSAEPSSRKPEVDAVDVAMRKFRALVALVPASERARFAELVLSMLTETTT
jgi:hypothetical protein